MKKILLLDKNAIFYSRRVKIFGVGAANLVIKLPLPFFKAFLLHFHFLARLFRLGVHHFISDGENGYYCVYNEKCARFCSEGSLIGSPVDLIGSRPLRVDLYKGMMIYGEYRSNPERDNVAVYSFDGFSQKKLFEVSNVRHIHSVKVKDDRVYFSTGDYEEESGIWFWDGKIIHHVLQGGQQRRAVDFILTDDGIYYGTDTPLEQNYIYKASYDGELSQLQSISGSVFYMSEQAGRYWLGTVIEPSKVNTSSYVELWASHVDDKSKWQLVQKFKKDLWPMKLFQYGQIQFPYITRSEPDKVWFYLLGVKGSGNSICIDTQNLK